MKHSTEPTRVVSQRTLNPQIVHLVEDKVLDQVTSYENLLKRHDVDPMKKGFEKLRAMPGPQANEVVAEFREWLRGAQEKVMPAIKGVEDINGENTVSNSPHLVCYINRAAGLLHEWDETLTQANVAYRDADLSEESSQRMDDLRSSGRAKANFTRTSAPK